MSDFDLDDDLSCGSSSSDSSTPNDNDISFDAKYHPPSSTRSKKATTPRTVQSLELDPHGNTTIRISLNQTTSPTSSAIDDDDDDDQSEDDDDLTSLPELKLQPTASTQCSPPTPNTSLADKYRHLTSRTPNKHPSPPPPPTSFKSDDDDSDVEYPESGEEDSDIEYEDAAMEKLRSEFAAVDARLGALSDDILSSPVYMASASHESTCSSREEGESLRNPSYSPLMEEEKMGGSKGSLLSPVVGMPDLGVGLEGVSIEPVLSDVEDGEEEEEGLLQSTPRSDAMNPNEGLTQSNGTNSKGLSVNLFDINEVVMNGTEISPLGTGRAQDKHLSNEPVTTTVVTTQSTPTSSPTKELTTRSSPAFGSVEHSSTTQTSNALSSPNPLLQLPQSPSHAGDKPTTNWGIFPPPANGTSFSSSLPSPIPSPVRESSFHHHHLFEDDEDDEESFFPNRKSAIVSRGISDGSVTQKQPPQPQPQPQPIRSPSSMSRGSNSGGSNKSVSFKEQQRPAPVTTRRTTPTPTTTTTAQPKTSTTKSRAVVRPPTRHWRDAAPPRKLPGQTTTTTTATTAKTTKPPKSKPAIPKARVAAAPVRIRPAKKTVLTLKKKAPKQFLRKSTEFSPMPKTKPKSKSVRRSGIGVGVGKKLELNPPEVKSVVKRDDGVGAWKGAMTMEQQRVSLLVEEKKEGQVKGVDVTKEVVNDELLHSVDVEAWKGAMTVKQQRASLLVEVKKEGSVLPLDSMEGVVRTEQSVGEASKSAIPPQAPAGVPQPDSTNALTSDVAKTTTPPLPLTPPRPNCMDVDSELAKINPMLNQLRVSSTSSPTIPQSPHLRTKAIHGSRRYSNLGKRDDIRDSCSASFISTHPAAATTLQPPTNQPPPQRALSVPKGPKLRTQAIRGDRRYSSLGRSEPKPHPITIPSMSPRTLTIPKGPKLQTQAIRGDRRYSNLGKRDESMMTTPDTPTRKIRPRGNSIPLPPPKGPTLRTQGIYGARTYSSSGRRDTTPTSSTPPASSSGARTLTVPKGPKLRTQALHGDRSYSALGKREKRMSPKGTLTAEEIKEDNWVDRKLTVPMGPKLTSPRNRAKLRSEENKENSVVNTSYSSNLSNATPPVPFKAKPIGPGVFGSKHGSHGCIGVRKIAKRKVTTPKPFRLSSEPRVREPSSPSTTATTGAKKDEPEKLKTTFTARSMPDLSYRPPSNSRSRSRSAALVGKDGGLVSPVSPPKKRQMTTPKPFRFATAEREKVHASKAIDASPTTKGAGARAEVKGVGQKAASHFTFDRPKSAKHPSPRKVTTPRPFTLSHTKPSPCKKVKLSKEGASLLASSLAATTASTALPLPPTTSQLENGTSPMRQSIQPPNPPPPPNRGVTNTRTVTRPKPFELRTTKRSQQPATVTSTTSPTKRRTSTAKAPVTHKFRARPLPKQTTAPPVTAVRTKRRLTRTAVRPLGTVTPVVAPSDKRLFRARPMPSFKKPLRPSVPSSSISTSTSTSTSKTQKLSPTTKERSSTAHIERQNQTMKEMADKREISAQSRVKRMEMAELLVQQAEQLQRETAATADTTSTENHSNEMMTTMLTVAPSTAMTKTVEAIVGN